MSLSSFPALAVFTPTLVGGNCLVTRFTLTLGALKTTMKLSAAFSILNDLYLSLRAAFIPTIRDIWRAPSLFLHPTALSRIFMAHVWVAFGNGTDENGRSTKQALITPHAHGVVLDLGAGHGHTLFYLDRARVTKYIALEPNTRMHDRIRAHAHAHGYSEADDTLTILACGAEDTAAVLAVFDGWRHGVDTIISVLTLCTVPQPEAALGALARDVLKSGGQFLFYEHVLSPREDVAWWQRFWTPVWRLAFDGCCLDRPTHLWVERMGVSDTGLSGSGVWESGDVWGKHDEPVENLFWHRVGRFTKA